MTFSAVIVAGGSGARAGPWGAKQWRNLGGKTVLRWSAEALLEAGAKTLIVVIPAGDETIAARALAGLSGWHTVTGGATRAESTSAGLAALGCSDDEIVLIHDAARPFLGQNTIKSLIAALEGCDGAIPALAAADTLKREDAEGTVTVPRKGIWRAQTPQAFRLGHLRAACAAWPQNEDATDEAGIVERFGGRVTLVPGDPRLFKLTYPEDFEMAQALCGAARVTCIGQGFDAHRFGEGDAVWLCGVQIAHSHSLIGHSDADAGLHALTDALLGAVGAGDIGDHFPPTDPKWKGAASDLFLRHAVDLITARSGAIVNVDVTLICESPKIKPHREAMRQRLAGLLNLGIDRVSVKATTTEGMGFTGRREGLAAQAIATVEMPR